MVGRRSFYFGKSYFQTLCSFPGGYSWVKGPFLLIHHSIRHPNTSVRGDDWAFAGNDGKSSDGNISPRNRTHSTHVSRTPKPEYLIALACSRNLLRGALGFGPIQFLMESVLAEICLATQWFQCFFAEMFGAHGIIIYQLPAPSKPYNPTKNHTAAYGAATRAIVSHHKVLEISVCENFWHVHCEKMISLF